MNFRHFLPGLAMCLPLVAAARPATPELVTLTNSDGTTVEVRAFGNEHFSYYTDAAGSTLMERDANGDWTAARRQGRALRPVDSDLNILRAEQTELEYAEPLQTRMAPINRNDGRTTFPTIGNDVHSLVVLIEYADTPFSIPDVEETFNAMLNKEGFSDYGAKGSARDYYIASSNGLFTPIFDITPVIKVSKSSAYYTGTGTNISGAGKNGRFGEAMEEALKYLDEELGWDFSKYDYDGDGDIDTIFFFYSGYGQADSLDPNTIWPHQADFVRYTTETQGSIGLEPLYLDGKRVGPYACSNELNARPAPGQSKPCLDGIGAFCHEFGHVLGLPDFYDTTGSGARTPGYWSVMDTGSYNDYSTRPPLFSSYEKWVCHWLEFDKAEEGTTLEIPSLTQTNRATRLDMKAFRPGYPVFENEFFILETRTNDGWDSALPGDGLLIWHIAFTYNDWTLNVVNTSRRLGISLVNSTSNEVAWPSTTGVNYVYPGCSNQLVTSLDQNVYNKFWLTGIKYDGKTTTVDYNLITEQPEAAPVMHTPWRSETGQELNLLWSAVPGAESYDLSVWAQVPNGGQTQTIYLGDLNETNVGNKTSYKVNYTPATANAQVYAKVRARIGIPSANFSNTVSFIPSQLGTTSAVEEIDLDAAVIAGAEGRIIAPAGARVYNLSGIETGTDSLPAGIYIVSYGGKSVKVTVR